jgi:hypothetical protein
MEFEKNGQRFSIGMGTVETAGKGKVIDAQTVIDKDTNEKNAAVKAAAAAALLVAGALIKRKFKKKKK